MSGAFTYLLNKENIIRAIRETTSNAEAARYLGVSDTSWKKYAKMFYNEDGITLYDSHLYGKSGKKRKPTPRNQGKKLALMDVILGKIKMPYSKTGEFLVDLFNEGILEEKCSHCGYQRKRNYDGRVPLMLTFRDGDRLNWKLENLCLVCWNCYFLTFGDVFGDNNLRRLQLSVSVIKNYHGIDLVDPDNPDKADSENDKHIITKPDITKDNIPDDFGDDLIVKVK